MNNKPKKRPPFGAALEARQRWRNLPTFVAICCGKNAWERAKRWNQSPALAGMVWTGDPPETIAWPVKDCRCFILWDDCGPNDEQVSDLICALFLAGAKNVTVVPLFADFDEPAELYDASLPVGQRWVRVRESVQFFGEPEE